MGKAGDQAVDKLTDAFRVFIVGIIIIYASYLIVKQILESAGLPPWIIYIILALLAFFVYLIRDKIIEFTKSILRR